MLNQGIVWDPESGPGDRYTKHHPVPYGEYIPFRDLWDPEFGQLALISRDMKSGTRTEPLRVGGVRVADAICFDVAYDDVMPPQVRDGAELLAVQTSNASFIFTHQIEQQFAITRLRAIEAGRWLTVASTNGRSGVIAPDGTGASRRHGMRETAVLVEEVGLATGLTPAMWLGALAHPVVHRIDPCRSRVWCHRVPSRARVCRTRGSPGEGAQRCSLTTPPTSDAS